MRTFASSSSSSRQVAAASFEAAGTAEFVEDLSALDAALEAAQKKMAAVDAGRAALREGFLRVEAGDVEGATVQRERAGLSFAPYDVEEAGMEELGAAIQRARAKNEAIARGREAAEAGMSELGRESPDLDAVQGHRAAAAAAFVEFEIADAGLDALDAAIAREQGKRAATAAGRAALEEALRVVEGNVTAAAACRARAVLALAEYGIDECDAEMRAVDDAIAGAQR